MTEPDNLKSKLCQGRCLVRCMGTSRCPGCQEPLMRFSRSRACLCILVPCSCCGHDFPRYHLDGNQLCRQCVKRGCADGHCCPLQGKVTQPSPKPVELPAVIKKKPLAPKKKVFIQAPKGKSV